MLANTLKEKFTFKPTLRYHSYVKKKIRAQDHRPKKNSRTYSGLEKIFWQDVPWADTLNFCISKLLISDTGCMPSHFSPAITTPARYVYGDNGNHMMAWKRADVQEQAWLLSSVGRGHHLTASTFSRKHMASYDIKGPPSSILLICLRFKQ